MLICNVYAQRSTCISVPLQYLQQKTGVCLEDGRHSVRMGAPRCKGFPPKDLEHVGRDVVSNIMGCPQGAALTLGK